MKGGQRHPSYMASEAQTRFRVGVDWEETIPWADMVVNIPHQAERGSSGPPPS